MVYGKELSQDGKADHFLDMVGATFADLSIRMSILKQNILSALYLLGHQSSFLIQLCPRRYFKDIW